MAIQIGKRASHDFTTSQPAGRLAPSLRPACPSTHVGAPSITPSFPGSSSSPTLFILTNHQPPTNQPTIDCHHKTPPCITSIGLDRLLSTSNHHPPHALVVFTFRGTRTPQGLGGLRFLFSSLFESFSLSIHSHSHFSTISSRIRTVSSSSSSSFHDSHHHDSTSPCCM